MARFNCRHCFSWVTTGDQIGEGYCSKECEEADNVVPITEASDHHKSHTLSGALPVEMRLMAKSFDKDPKESEKERDLADSKPREQLAYIKMIVSNQFEELSEEVGPSRASEILSERLLETHSRPLSPNPERDHLRALSDVQDPWGPELLTTAEATKIALKIYLETYELMIRVFDIESDDISSTPPYHTKPSPPQPSEVIQLATQIMAIDQEMNRPKRITPEVLPTTDTGEIQ